MANVLIIDDDRMFCEMMTHVISAKGHAAISAFTRREGLKCAVNDGFDVIFLDVNLPDGSGLDILPALRDTPSRPEVIIITGVGDSDGAELAFKSGAWDYIEKPYSNMAITLQLVRALEYREEKKSGAGRKDLDLSGIIGSSPAMRTCLDLLAQAAEGDVSTLITGQTGTGKELMARAIHLNSKRAGRPFVVVDCAAMPETLVESLLFGHEKGSFTGAYRVQQGLIAQADGGTLFLDEVGDMPMSIQKSFLRVLQERRFRAIGGKAEIESDFRLVAATNRNLEEMVARGEFRHDLLYRLQSFVIELPPLRERGRDIEELAGYFTTTICRRHGIAVKSFSPELIASLTAYDWPGNVRELLNTMERVIAAAYQYPTIYPAHLPANVRLQARQPQIGTVAPACPPVEGLSAASTMPRLADYRNAAVAEAERRYLQNLMDATSGDIAESCRISGLSRPRLYALLRQHSIARY